MDAVIETENITQTMKAINVYRTHLNHGQTVNHLPLFFKRLLYVSTFYVYLCQEVSAAWPEK